MTADRGLGDVQQQCSLGQVAMLGNRHERAYLIDFHRIGRARAGYPHGTQPNLTPVRLIGKRPSRPCAGRFFAAQ